MTSRISSTNWFERLVVVAEPALQVVLAGPSREGRPRGVVVDPGRLTRVPPEGGKAPLQIRDEVRGGRQEGVVADQDGRVVDIEEPSELTGRVRMVVHPKVDVAVVPTLVAASLPNHQERGGLPAAPVPACRVTGEQRRQEPVAQVAVRLRERPGHRVHHLLADQDVALRREPGSGRAAGPLHARRARERGGAAGRIHHTDLPIRAAFVAVDERAQGIRRPTRHPPSARAPPVRTTCSPTTASRPRPRRPSPTGRPRRRTRTSTPPPRPSPRHPDPRRRSRTSSAHPRRSSWNEVR